MAHLKQHIVTILEADQKLRYKLCVATNKSRTTIERWIKNNSEDLSHNDVLLCLSNEFKCEPADLLVIPSRNQTKAA